MARWSLLVFLLASVLHAQEKDGKLIVAFDVQAKAAPKPALRYQLLPELDEITPGTALQHYLKCFMEQNSFYHSKEAGEQRDKWLAMPIKDLPVAALRDYGGKSLRYADAAARMERIEWQILPEMRREGFGTLLPEIQKLRTLTAALKVRLRGEIADKRFDDAIGTIKTLYKLGHQLGEHPTIIANLVGIAIVAIATGGVEEMIQQPGCPNLYWAFASLPSPLVSIRTGAAGERIMWRVELKRLKPLDQTAPVAEAVIDKFIAALERLVRDIGGQPQVDVREYIEKQIKQPNQIQAARGRLVEQGLKADVLAKMPARQVVILDEQFTQESAVDDGLKWITQPYWRAESKYVDLEQRRGKALFVDLLPSVKKIHTAQTRIEQRLRMLQVLEAIRMHAAANKGVLPAKLDDIEVLLPIDPYSGKPFGYTAKDGKASLSGTPPKGSEKVPAFNVVYEVKITK